MISSWLILWMLLVLGASALMLKAFQRSKGPPRVGRHPGLLLQNMQAIKRDFQSTGRNLVKDAYEKHKDRYYVVQTLDRESIVLAPKFLPEIRMLPESKMSHSMALVEKFLGYYTGVDVILESRQHIDVCRLQLTQNLVHFVPQMHEAYGDAREKFLGVFSDHDPVSVYGFVFSMVLAITSTVFVGQDLAADKRWQEVVADYLKEVVNVAQLLKPYPRWLRPILKPIIAPSRTIEQIFARADALLTQPILNRRDKTYTELDVMTFLAQAQETPNPRQVILQLLVLVSAALHTSTMAAVHAIFDLCTMPDTTALLRREVQNAVEEEKGAWTMGTIRRLQLVDSFLKESFRFNQPESLGLSRIAMSDVELSDGSSIPKGSFINMAAEAMSRDPQFYPEPDAFKADRFYRPERAMRSSNQAQENEFAGIEPGNIAWGSGRSTCPGRWYASAMNKLIIGGLLERYHVSFPEGQTNRPDSLHNNGSIIPSPQQAFTIREV